MCAIFCALALCVLMAMLIKRRSCFVVFFMGVVCVKLRIVDG
jgi:hypothetical protein